MSIWRRVSPLGRASPLCRDPASQLNSLSKFVFVYMRGRPALLGGDLAIDYPRSRLGGLEIFHINALERAGLPRRASKSKLRIHTTKFVFASIFWINVCLCVGYKMKTCTQISDSGFRGKINVVSRVTRLSRASPSRRAAFSRVLNAR